MVKFWDLKIKRKDRERDFLGIRDPRESRTEDWSGKAVKNMIKVTLYACMKSSMRYLKHTEREDT